MKTQKTNGLETVLPKILVTQGVITDEEATAIQQAFHESEIDQFDDFLISEGLVDQKNLLEALAEFFQVPAFDVIGYFFERHLLHMFPKHILIKNRMIPLEVDENIMIMIASNPHNPDLLAEIGEHVSYDIRLYVGIGQDIIDAIEEFYDKSDTEEEKEEEPDILHEKSLITGEFEYEEDQIEGESYEDDFEAD